MSESDEVWYVADLIVEFQVEDDARNVVHRNLTLLQASNAEAAYEHALVLGRRFDADWQNTYGKLVKVRFRGIGYLGVLEDGVQDGAEVLWKEDVGISEEQIGQWLKPRNELSAFQVQRGVPDPDVPNYGPGDIIQEAEDAVRESSGQQK